MPPPLSNRLKPLLLLIPIFVITASCGMVDPEMSVSRESFVFSIDADTILDDLNKGNSDVFTPMAESNLDPNPGYGDPVQWNESDYFLIAQALHSLVWGESLDNWHPNFLMFRMDCIYDGKGYEAAAIRYFKVDQIREKESRFESELIIEPRRGFVVGVQEEFFPNREKRIPIDLNILEVKLKDAFDIAEKNGGREIRENIENECEIDFFLNPGWGKDTIWEVLYLNYSGDLLGEYLIDPMTGELLEK